MPGLLVTVLIKSVQFRPPSPGRCHALGDEVGMISERDNLMFSGRVFLGEWMPGVNHQMATIMGDI